MKYCVGEAVREDEAVNSVADSIGVDIFSANRHGNAVNVTFVKRRNADCSNLVKPCLGAYKDSAFLDEEA